MLMVSNILDAMRYPPASCRPESWGSTWDVAHQSFENVRATSSSCQPSLSSFIPAYRPGHPEHILP